MNDNSKLDRLKGLKELLVNNFMISGHKEKAKKIVANIFLTDNEIIDCMEKLQVDMFTKKRVIAGSAKHIPVSITQTKKDSLAVKWFVKGTRMYIKKGSNAIAAGRNLLKETLESRGAAMQFKQEVIQRVKENRAFAGYRW